jgi:hypothetical protein
MTIDIAAIKVTNNQLSVTVPIDDEGHEANINPQWDHLKGGS